MDRARTFSFGPFQLSPERQLLTRDLLPVRIGGRALDLLTALVERPGEVVTKAELMSAAWPSTFVDDANLKVNVGSLRRVLGDGVDGNYIATVTGRGYRFVAPVHPTSRLRPEAPTMVGGNDNLPIETPVTVGRSQAELLTAPPASAASPDAPRLLVIMLDGLEILAIETRARD